MKYINSLIICIIISIGIMQAQNYMCTEYSGGIVSLSGDSATIKLCAEDYNPYTVGNDPHTMSVNLPSGRQYSITGRVELEQVLYLDFIVIREEDASGNTLSTLATYGYSTVEGIHLVTKHKTGRISIDIYCFYGATTATSGFEFNIAPAVTDTIETGYVIGYLGVGTSAPDKPLHVMGDMKLSWPWTWLEISQQGAYPSIRTSANKFVFNKPIYSNGINVTGEIHSDSIKTGAIVVESVSGADFVFDNNYDLLSLDDVNAYIQAHGHLPAIPSAEQMQQDGVDMSKFQIQLLQKIEELTLYIIKQDERIKELENKESRQIIFF